MSDKRLVPHPFRIFGGEDKCVVCGLPRAAAVHQGATRSGVLGSPHAFAPTLGKAGGCVHCGRPPEAPVHHRSGQGYAGDVAGKFAEAIARGSAAVDHFAEAGTLLAATVSMTPDLEVRPEMLVKLAHVHAMLAVAQSVDRAAELFRAETRTQEQIDDE